MKKADATAGGRQSAVLHPLPLITESHTDTRTGRVLGRRQAEIVHELSAAPDVLPWLPRPVLVPAPSHPLFAIRSKSGSVCVLRVEKSKNSEKRQKDDPKSRMYPLVGNVFVCVCVTAGQDVRVRRSGGGGFDH